MGHVAEIGLTPPLGVPHTAGLQMVLLVGRIEIGASGAVDTTNSKLPNGVSVAETATGVYTITAPGFDSAVGPLGFCTFHDTSGGDTYATGKSCSQTSGATSFVLSTFGADGVAEEPNAADYIDFLIIGFN